MHLDFWCFCFCIVLYYFCTYIFFAEINNNGSLVSLHRVAQKKRRRPTTQNGIQMQGHLAMDPMNIPVYGGAEAIPAKSPVLPGRNLDRYQSGIYESLDALDTCGVDGAMASAPPLPLPGYSLRDPMAPPDGDALYDRSIGKFPPKREINGNDTLPRVENDYLVAQDPRPNANYHFDAGGEYVTILEEPHT